MAGTLAGRRRLQNVLRYCPWLASKALRPRLFPHQHNQAHSVAHVQAKGGGGKYKVIAYDFGIKSNILRRLSSLGCDVTVVPAQTSAEDVLGMNPDGVFLSNGPVRF